VKLFLAFHSSVEFDDTSYDNSYTISVLSVGDIKYRGTILNLVGEEGKVYPVGYNEKGGLINAIDERIDLFKLLVGKYESPKSNRVIRLRLRTLHYYTTYLAFINAFN